MRIFLVLLLTVVFFLIIVNIISRISAGVIVDLSDKEYGLLKLSWAIGTILISGWLALELMGYCIDLIYQNKPT